MIKTLIQNKVTCNFNPFGGLKDEELPQILVPKSFFNEIILELNKNKHQIIQFVGAKGRGKTSHLKLLHQYFAEQPIYLLEKGKNNNKILNIASNMIFVDSVHHLSLKNRMKLYKQNKTIILTTHLPRQIEFWMVSKNSKTYRFKGLNEETLSETIKNRISLAAGIRKEEVIINPTFVKDLLLEFGDDFRGILNYLYDQYDKI